ncbi:MAG: Two-component transcriptional response regulator, LuxR family [uncultured Thermoleophilia bacterium]|uniref:Two-component transcriptional response regulator, LuxR family n=1 Tax=uncultured Thermoleophilia bacterium TaxID=1497501 RepID=A0A6J4TSY6_9ACTN|nr:MAG: Two-component transcriptional response regulator, LuxR family [uncultured Thermoleophilia bacterium]
MRLLVVEDEHDLADAIAEGLRQEGYAVDVAYDGETGRRKALGRPYDLVCLDLSLPRVDGREVLRALRDAGRDDGAAAQRVLVLTARDALDDRIAGLDDGADDYLVKPFEFRELTARIRALLRRRAGAAGAVVRVGDLALDDARHVARRADVDLGLTPKEFALLRYLMSRADEVISEGELLRHVWDENANPFTNTVRVTVGTLRRKLGRDGADQPLETVVGSGYRLRSSG